MTDKQKYYPELNPKMNFSKMEEEILRIWDDKKIFETITELIKKPLPLEQISGFEARWLNPNIADKGKMTPSFKTPSSDHELARQCERIPGRKKFSRMRQREVCALLLPNFGVK